LSLASDKCIRESECLSFTDHIVATTEIWERHLNETGGSHHRPTVIFTTEAKDMMLEHQTWAKENEHSKLPFDFDFVTNTRDILPDSGWMKDIGTYTMCLLICKLAIHSGGTFLSLIHVSLFAAIYT